MRQNSRSRKSDRGIRQRKPGTNRSWSLSTKLSGILGIVTLALFIVLNLMIVFVAGRALSREKIHGLCSISDANAEKLAQTTLVNESIARNLENSLKIMYGKKDYSEIFISNPYSLVDNTHRITDIRFQEEQLILNTLRSAIEGNENIVGGGVFFEKNAFQSNLENYAPYISRDDAKNGIVRNIDYAIYGEEDGYFRKVQETRQPFYTDPYTGKLSGQTIVTAVYPIFYWEQFVGAVIIDLDPRSFGSLSAMQNEKYRTLFFDVISSSGTIVSSTTDSAELKRIEDLMSAKSSREVREGMSKGSQFELLMGDHVRCLTPVQMGSETWWMQASIEAAEFNADKMRLFWTLSAAELVILLEILLLTMAVVRKSLRPLTMISSTADRMSRGELDAELDYPYHDDIGDLVRSINAMQRRVREIIENLGEKLGKLSGGNFAIDHPGDGELYIGAYQPLLASLNSISEQLSRMISNIRDAAKKVNDGAGQVSSGAQALSQGAMQQASSIEELSASMNTISGKVQETAKTAQQASALSAQARDAVDISNSKMEELSRAMQDITEKSHEIGKIIKTIDDIAFQTNILSLNAAIEAARAGAAGKGFAVVADEVGNLAQKSAKAAQNTSDLIGEALEAISRGAEITEKTAEALRTVSGGAMHVNGLIRNISDASNEEAKGIAQFTAGLDQISSVVQTNSATSEESAAASEEMARQARQLNELVAFFKLRGETNAAISESLSVQAPEPLPETALVPPTAEPARSETEPVSSEKSAGMTASQSAASEQEESNCAKKATPAPRMSMQSPNPAERTASQSAEPKQGELRHTEKVSPARQVPAQSPEEPRHAEKAAAAPARMRSAETKHTAKAAKKSEPRVNPLSVPHPEERAAESPIRRLETELMKDFHFDESKY